MTPKKESTVCLYDDILSRIEDVAKELMADKKISFDTFSTYEDLIQQGFDSLDIIELTMALEEEYGIVLDDDVVSRLKNIGELMSYIHRQRVIFAKS